MPRGARELAEVYRENIDSPGWPTSWRLWHVGVRPLGYARYISQEARARSITAYSPNAVPELVYSPEYGDAISKALGEIVGPSGLEFGPLMLARQEALQARGARVTAYVTEMALRSIADIFPREANTQFEYFRSKLREERGAPTDAQIRIRIVRATQITPESVNFLHWDVYPTEDRPEIIGTPYAALLGRILTPTQLETNPFKLAIVRQGFNTTVSPHTLNAAESLRYLQG